MPSRRTTAGTQRPADRPVTPELVRSALVAIPPGLGHDDRVRVAFAVYDGIGDAGADLWLDWAAGRDGADAAEDRAVWKSARKPGKTKVGTLFGLASDYGWKFPEAGADAPRVDPGEVERQAEERRHRREQEEGALLLRRQESAKRAKALWDKARATPPAAGCPYLQRKGVQGHGLRYLVDGTALVPMRDEKRRMWSVQRLLPRPLKDRETGDAITDKLYGPPKASPEEEQSSRKLGLWHMLGNATSAPAILLAEGYATAASVHEATGRPVAVCFDAGNLVHVARALRALHPAALLLVCGDDDTATEERRGKNPGRIAAAKAAHEVHSDAAPAGAVFPEGLADGGKDFNDLHAAQGLEAVRQQIERACAAPVLPDKPPARQPAKPAAGATNGAKGKGKAAPPADERASGPPADDAAPPWRDPFMLDEFGVWHRGRDREGNEKRPQWLCAPLRVTARTRADDGNGWGYLLEFSDPDGTPKTWAMPSAMLSGEGAEWAGRLRDMGLRMAPGSAPRNLIAQYIDTREPEDRVTCTDRVGWHGPVYVLPSGSIGTDEGRRYVFQSDAGMEDTFRRHGTLQQWQQQVAALAQGNSRLVFALACAFAGPMLRLAGMESGGFHLRGTSSMGKTTALKVAASVWGRPTYMQRWRTTDNALEATAVQHSDCTLILDEFGQLDPRVAGECAYMLEGGLEKGRNTRNGQNRRRRTWRLLFLSSGEVSLADHMAEAGKRTQAGQEVRMVDVPLDAGAGMGGLEERHGRESPAALADEVTNAAARFYGTAGRTWLEWATAHVAELPQRLQELADRYRADMVPEAASEQVRRIGSRFALVAAAGELATEAAGLTGWPPGHAAWGVRRCFEAWLAARGHLDNGEDAAMLRQVRAWIEKNGDALLTWTHRALDDHKASTPLRAGFKRLLDEQGKPLKWDAAQEYLEQRSALSDSQKATALVEYLLLPEAFKREVCKGFDPAAVAKLLAARGHLVHERDRYTNKQRLPGMGPAACYQLRPSIFADEL